MTAYLKLARVVFTNYSNVWLISIFIYILLVFLVPELFHPAWTFTDKLDFLQWNFWVLFWILIPFYGDDKMQTEYFLHSSERQQIEQALSDFGFEKYKKPTPSGKYFYFRKVSRHNTQIATVQDFDNYFVLTTWPQCTNLFEPRIGPGMLI